ncbi:MAG: alpha/beta hydrolase [Chloroflexota bacterium]|nr:alpha/beta hydrolase [Chloroflexota bacterium]
MIDPQSSFVQANGLRLNYLTWGEANARPIVLNHATGFLARLWEPVAVRLADAGYRVLAYDARGHGDSEKPEPMLENYDWLRAVDDLRGFLDATGLRGVPFVGHSFGGATGLYLAGTRPEYLSRIVAIEPIVMPGGFTPDATRRDEMAAGARRRRHVFASAEEMIEQYRSRPAFAKWTDETLRLYVEHGTIRREDGSLELKCSGEIEGAMFWNSGSLPVWEVLPQLEAPVLVMRGETTEGLLSMVAESVASRAPQGTLETIPDAGHLAPMEQPAAVAAAVLRVVDSR